MSNLKRIAKAIKCCVIVLPCLFLLYILFVIYFLPFCGEVLIPAYYSAFPKQCAVTEEPIVINGTDYNHANDCQNNANVWLGVDNGKLYFYPHWYYDVQETTQYKHYLSVFEKGRASRLIKFNGKVIGTEDGYVYLSAYDRSGSTIPEEGLYKYNLATRNIGQLPDMLSRGFVAPDGLIGFVSDTKAQYEQGHTTRIYPAARKEFILNKHIYALEGIPGNETIVITDSSGIRTELEDRFPKGNKNMFQCKQGLIVQNVRDGKMLYLIRPDGEIVTLFEVTCVSAHSAVNQYGDWIFLSFSRYTYSEELEATVPFENDTLTGTYRINLLDYSCEKISNHIYTGLYIFDDSGIYACDRNCHIYKLDFDGNIIDILLE